MPEKRKKIIMAVTNDLVTDQRVNKICLSLHSENYEVLLVGRKLSDSPELPQLPYKTKRLRLCFNKGALFYAFFNIQLFFFLLFHKTDIITANDLDTLPACYFAACLKNKSLVYDSHEYFTEVPEIQNKKLVKKIWTSIESYIFPKLKNVSTVCQSIADVYNKKYNVPVKVIKNVPIPSIEVNTTKPEKPEAWKDKKIIIYQGAVNLGRGLELMIETMPLLNNFIFIIIGGGDIIEDLRKKIIDLDLNNKVILLGKLHYSKLQSYTRIADCGFSLEEAIGLNYYYAPPNKLFDYIHASIPFIVSDLPEMRRIVETYKIGEILVERNPDSLAKCINKLLETSIDEQRYANAKKNSLGIMKKKLYFHCTNNLLKKQNDGNKVLEKQRY
ncbi:MAG: glycosyltransferase [Bacteroidales bacterium]|nr:glycosyltransferase [Bacteroidales bacterium]